MNTILESIANWTNQLWPFMFNHLWQATLFAFLVLIASHLIKRIPAKAQHAVWLIALVKFALPSAAVFLLAKIAGIDFDKLFIWHTNAVSSSNVATLTLIAEPVMQKDSDTVSSFISSQSVIYTGLTIIWLLTGLAFLAFWCRRRIQLTRAIKTGQIVYAGREAESLKRVKSWLLIDRDIDLILSPRVNEPGVWRVWNPVIVLPTGISEHLNEAELDTVIMHELFHVIRRDNLFGNLQMVLCCLFWFHPIVWLIDRKLLAERERACDEAVVDHCGTSLIYASGILKVCKMGLTPGWKVAGVSGVSGSNLDKRIEHIMKNTASGRLKTAHWLLVGGLVVTALCLSIGAGIFSRSTVSAQSFVANDGRTYQTGETIEVPIRFSNQRGFNEKIPFLFSNAKAEVTKVEMISASPDPVAEANFNHYRIKMKVSLENNWAQRLTGLGVFLRNEEWTWSVYIEQVNLSIEPFGRFEFERQVIVTLPNETPLGSLFVEPAAAQSEEGGRWGGGVPSMLRPPPPPPPPRPQSGVAGGIRGGVYVGVGRGVPGGVHGGEFELPVSAAIRPEYTTEARRNRTQGDVRLRALIASDGAVEKAEVVQGLPDGLNEQAIKCVKQVKFSKGEPHWINLRIVFSLADY